LCCVAANAPCVTELMVTTSRGLLLLLLLFTFSEASETLLSLIKWKVQDHFSNTHTITVLHVEGGV